MAPFVIPSSLFVVLSVPLIAGVVPPNPVYGVRTRATLSDPERWYAVNRKAGIGLVTGSVAYLGFAASGVVPYVPADPSTFGLHLLAFLGPLALGFGAAQISL